MLPKVIKFYPENPQPGVEQFYDIAKLKKFAIEHIISSREVCEEDFRFDQRDKEQAVLL